MEGGRWKVPSRRTGVRGQRVLVTCVVKWEVRRAEPQDESPRAKSAGDVRGEVGSAEPQDGSPRAKSAGDVRGEVRSEKWEVGL